MPESFQWECREQFNQVILEPRGVYLLMTAPAFTGQSRSHERADCETRAL